MTDRYDAFLVVLDRSIRDDDAESTVAAIRQIKGVLDVQPHTTDVSTAIAKMQVKQEVTTKLLQILKEI